MRRCSASRDRNQGDFFSEDDDGSNGYSVHNFLWENNFCARLVPHPLPPPAMLATNQVIVAAAAAAAAELLLLLLFP